TPTPTPTPTTPILVAVTNDVPRTAVIADDVPITVTASAGDDIDIVIDDILEFNDEHLIDGEAEVAWDTTGKPPGSCLIKVFVNCDVLTAAMSGTNVRDEIEEYGLEAEGTATILLVFPGVTAEQPKEEIARGSSYVVKGTVTGVDVVDIAIIGPEGLTENNMGIEYGFELTTSSVSENEFEKGIVIPGGAETGEYVTIVLVVGRDGYYADTNCGAGEFEDALEAFWGWEVPEDLVGRDQEQIIAIIEEVTYRAGSDDLLAMLTFRVT
ncbi:MAG: hypothetical protein KAU16_03330, partial [Methanophagales archaeon]|nr:hypothetical protein [Methanophagales archaeon]